MASANPTSTSNPTAALEAAKARFLARNPKSLQLHEEATASLPGGNTRTVLHTAPFPISMARGQGYQLFSEDGHTYTDLTGEFTAGLYGHSHPLLVDAITSTLTTHGLNLGATTAHETRYAALLRARFRSLERLRFCNSGTEANLHALAAARAHTGRRRVVVFGGGYHGGVLSFGHGGRVAPNNVDRADWVVARYNDVDRAREAILGTEGGGGGVAAVLVEPMQGSGGCVAATREFLVAVQEAAREAGAVFILDEVMTSRMGPGGLQGELGLRPDLTTLGKYLGGGLAFGAFGGREDVMAVFDPRREGALAQSGTFNNNTLAMRAGYVGLSEVFTPEVSEGFMKVGNELLGKLRGVTVGTKATFTGVGSVMCLHITDEGVRDIACVDDVKEREDLKELFWMEMLEEGFWITKRGMIALVLGTPQSELDRFVSAVTAFLERHRDLMAL